MDKDSKDSVKSDKHLFQKGFDPRRNTEGRPVGSRDFATDFDEVVEEIAAEDGITKSQARKHLLKVAYKNAKEGNYSFYKDIHDRIYGQPKSHTDITTQGEKITTPLTDQAVAMATEFTRQNLLNAKPDKTETPK
jgi:hypothetical protein